MARHTLRLRAENPKDLARAGAMLREGGLVAFPTETVYGLGANALDAAAVEAIFTAKRRPAWDPVIVHVPDRQKACSVAQVPSDLEERVDRLAAAFWPGPLTLLLPRGEELAPAVTAGRELVGVRVPRDPVALRLLREAGVPVAAPSANRFGHISPTTADHVLADLDGRIDAVLDGGPATVGVESTVLDVSSHPMRIYRPGAISAGAIAGVAGPVEFVQPAMDEHAAEGKEARAREIGLPSPGFGLRHYAPHTPLRLVESEGELADACRDPSGNAGVLLPDGWDAPYAAVRFAWGPWDRPEILARNLYAGLRTLDDAHVSVIVCPLPAADEGIRDALRDRLRKAAMPA